MATAALRLTGNVIFNQSGNGNARVQMEQIGFPAHVITSGRLDSARLPANPQIFGNLTPIANVTYDLGSATHRWRDLYLSGNTIVLGNTFIREGEDQSVQLGGSTTTVTAESFAGNGALLTHLDASQLTSGVVPNSRISGAYTGFTTLETSGDVTVGGNLYVLTGNVVEIQTETQITDQLIVTNAGTGPALIVDQTGSEDIADFKDDGNVVVRIHDGGAVSIGGDVAAPLGTLHVVGNVYASGVYSGNGALLTSLDASELTGGILPAARFGANVKIGTGAGETEAFSNIIAIGVGAGASSQGMGWFEGTYADDGGDAIAIGRNAGASMQGEGSVAIGLAAGFMEQGRPEDPAGDSYIGNAVAIGIYAGSSSQGSESIAIGSSAGNSNQGIHAVSIGSSAGRVYQRVRAVAVGHLAGSNNQGAEGVAVGYGAGQTSQNNAAVAVGGRAGQTLQGSNAVAIGLNAGQTSQNQWAVAIGEGAGASNQTIYSVAIGRFAAEIGGTAGFGQQVAIGHEAGRTSQNNYAIAIGRATGQDTQGSFAVAVGGLAGQTSQGSNAVAIGWRAGESNQASNSIVINATGATVNNTTANSCVIKPVRDVASVSRRVALYDSTSGEVSTNSANFVVDASNRVGIGNQAPARALHVGDSSDLITDTNAIRVESRGFAGLEILGDSTNATTGGEPGGAFVQLSQDGGIVASIIGMVQNAGGDGKGGSYTGTLTNSTLVGGQYSGGALHLGTSSTVRATISSGGNVGIGTTAPAYTLDVSGTARITSNLFFNNQVQNNMITLYGSTGLADTDVYGFGINSSTLRYNAGTGAIHRWFTNNVSTMHLGSTGTLSVRLGINTGFDGSAHPAGDHRIRNHAVTTAGGFVAANDGYTDVWGLRNGTSDNNAVFYAVSGNVPRHLLDKAGRVWARSELYAGVQRTDAGASTTYTTGDFRHIAYGGTGGAFTASTDGQTWIRGIRNATAGDEALFYADSGGLVRGKLDKNGSWWARNSYFAGRTRGSNNATDLFIAGNHGFFAYDTVSNTYSFMRARNTSDTVLVIDILVAGARKFSVSSAGAMNSVSGSLTGHSDMKLKQDISDAHSQWEDLKKFKWRRYRLKREVEEHGDDTAKHYLGVIAQEIQDTSPHLVDPMYKTDENHNNTDEIDFYTVNYGAIWMKSAACLKEAMLRIEALEAENAALKSQFEARLAALEASASASASA
jgi:hypothetical protein